MRGLLVFLVVLALLAVAADRAAWYVAERATATAIQQSEDLADRPEVDIEGIPFLTQAWRGTYQEVNVRVTDLPAEEGVRIDELQARLRGLHVPLRDLVNRSVREAPVDVADASGRMSFASLDAAALQRIPSEQLTVRFSAGSDTDRVKVDGEYAGPVGPIRLSGEARLEIQDDSLVITVVPDSLDIPAVFQRAVARLLGVNLALPELPLGFRPTNVEVSESGIVLDATGQDVVLAPPG